MNDVLAQLIGAQAWLVLLAVGALVFVEDAVFVGFLLPGESAAIVGGVSARLGHVPLWAVVLTVIIAAVSGDSVGYELGRRVGPRLLEHRLLQRYRARIARAQDVLVRRGGAAVFLGRWAAFLRATMPALAGASRMPYRTFLTFNAAGGILWGLVVVLLGYVAGTAYQTLESNLGRGTAVTAGALVVIGFVAWRIRRHHLRSVSTDHYRPGSSS